jgi:hypothetical protein
MLLGRWARIAERHGGGCSCCPGLGDIAMSEVEQRVTEWLRQRHALGESLTVTLQRCIAERTPLDEPLERDIDEALAELERIQSGMP